MSNLAVKTRGDSSPQGKPRVYFSCHPDDFEKYFALLSGEIFETQNCAIYYESDRNEDADPEDLSSHLSDMQLFVVPITTNFLIKPSRARDFEYGFANEQHTPILPLAMEPGMDELFPEIMNRIGDGYGDIQFLDRTLNYPTAISYKEKLKTRLDAILVGDELAERVRAAFDAYIFLSYRKKDLVEAQDLMRLIHRIPYCRDIAIWYDEFLVPGEAFDSAITEAIAKSALVVLAVTPNLTEPENYIIQHEYPDAVKNEKKVVPTELVPTDREKLKTLFPGIADVIDGKDVDAVSTALHDELSKYVLRGKDENPEHNYLIGLAYLGGIDVERDPQKAVGLIRGAAEKDLPEAIKKLASMYHDGDGVKRDYNEEVVWLRKMVEVCRKAYEGSGEENNGIKLISSCCVLGDALVDIGKISEAKEAYELMLGSTVKIYEDYPNFASLSRIGISYDKLGDITSSQGKLTEAEAWYRKGFKLREELNEEMGTVGSQWDLSISYSKLGDIASSQGKLTEAETWYRKSLKLDEELCEKIGTVELRRDLSVSYYLLGDIAKSQGRLTEAETWYRTALKLREDLNEEMSTVESRRDLSVSYIRLGDIASSQRKLTEAEMWYRKGSKLSEELNEKTGTVKSRRDLTLSYKGLGDIAKSKGKLTEAETWYGKGLKLSEELCDETGTLESRRDLSESYYKLGDLAKSQGKLIEAETWYRKGFKLSEELCSETGTLESRRDLNVSYNRLGVLAKLQGKLTEAEVWFRKSLKLSEELCKETGTAESYDDLSVSYYKLAMLSYNNKNSRDAVEYLKKAIEILEMLVKATDTPRYRKNLEIIEKALNIVKSD